jgi:RNA polymerase sigma-70 factor (ECF subfamily)
VSGEAARDAESQEAELVGRLKAGDPSAFEPIMRRYNRRLFRIARAVTQNDAEAETWSRRPSWPCSHAFINTLASIRSVRG